MTTIRLVSAVLLAASGIIGTAWAQNGVPDIQKAASKDVAASTSPTNIPPVSAAPAPFASVEEIMAEVAKPPAPVVPAPQGVPVTADVLAGVQAKIDAIANAPATQPQRTPPWNSVGSDITPDTRSTYGVLPNGMRYVIRNNDKPKDQVQVRLRFDFGSAAEAEDEQGLAHFIEHLALNETTNVPDGEMIKLLQRKGLAFGADTNASTGYLDTIYMLNLPKPSDDLINTSLFLMREVAGEATFSSDVVEKERGVILEERRVRENFAYQSTRAAQTFLRPNTYFSTRYPIGTEAVIKTASPEKIRNLYRTYYRPERATLIIAGPIDVAAVEQKIATAFGSWKGQGAGPTPKKSTLDSCSIDLNRPRDGAIFTHPQITESVSIIKTSQSPFTRFSKASRNTAQILSLGEAAFARRVSRIVREGNAPFLGVGINYSYPTCGKYAATSLGIGAKDGKWEEAVPAAEQLLRQAVKYGFTQAELDEQIKETRVSRETAVKTEPTIATGAIVGGHLAQLSPFKPVNTTAQWRLDEWRKLEKTLTLKSVNAAFAKTYAALDSGLVFATAKPENLKDKGAVLAAFDGSRKVAVKPPATQAAVKFAYGDFGAPGKIVEDKVIADLDIRTIRFANGVMLNLKKTPYDANSIFISMAIDGGDLLLPRDKADYDNLGDYISAGGLGKHKADDLQSITAGTTAGAGLSASSDSFVSSGTVVQKDLPLQLQLMAAYVTDPGFRDEALVRFRKILPEFYARLDATPNDALGNQSGSILYDNDPRYILAPIETLQALNWSEYRSLIGDALSKNAMEIGIVGDFDMEATIAEVAKTFGALPPRAPAFADRTEARRVAWGPKRGTFELQHKGEPDQLLWQRIWPTTDGRDQKLDRTMDLLADIIDVRLAEELREKAGASYGSSVGSSMSIINQDFGSFTISTNGDVAKRELIEKTVQKVVDEVRSKPVDSDVFERARKPELESYVSWRQRNGTWRSLLEDAQTYPVYLDRFRRDEDIFKSITPADVQAAAKKWLRDDQAFTFRVVPAAKAATTSVNSPAPKTTTP